MTCQTLSLYGRGARGARGNSILNGPAAPSGSVGGLGDFYLETTNEVLYGPKTSLTAWPSTGVRIAGATILSGVGAPSNGLGHDGDFYLETVNDVFYGPKALGAWPGSGVRIAGAAVLNGVVAPTTEGHDGDFYIDTVAFIFYGPKASGTWPSTGLYLGPTYQLKSFSANHTAIAAEAGFTLRFNASGAGSGLICTIPRNLGSLVSTGLYNTRRFIIERDPADLSSNPIIIQNDLGAEVGRIINPVNVGQVPWLEAYADGTTVVCRGVP